MPLPNADRDKRLYALLKTQDLENLSYSDFQSAAEKIFVQDINEDDLRRVVLIQLARMAVAGEWNGFTSSGGGSGSGDFGTGGVMVAGSIFIPGQASPYGGADFSTSTIGTNFVNCYPFVAPFSGNVSNLQIRINSATASNNWKIAIYADSGSGYPTTKVGGDVTIPTNSTGVISGTPASTISLVQGTKYWFGYTLENNYTGSSPTMYICTEGSGIGWNSALSQSSKLSLITSTGSQNSLDSTLPTSDYNVGFNKKMLIGITYA